MDLGRKTYSQEMRKTLLTLESLDGFTSCKYCRAVRERGFPARSAGERLLARNNTVRREEQYENVLVATEW